MIAERILRLLAEKFPGCDPRRSIVQQLDSLQQVELVNAVETEFNVQILSIEVDDDNFRDVAQIEKLIAQKINAINATNL